MPPIGSTFRTGEPYLHEMLEPIGDEAGRKAFVEQERQLLYVACTRARERLVVSYAGKGSRLG